MGRRLTHLPIRLRLTLAVATAMAVAFAALGTFILVQFRHDVLRTLDEGMRSRLRDVGTLAGTRSVGQIGRLAQVYGPDGTLRSTSSDLRRARLLSRRQAARAAARPVSVPRRSTPA